MTVPGERHPVASPGRDGIGPTRAWVRDFAFRLERHAAQRVRDIESHQLRSLQRAYRGRKGPELLIFGDSHMFFPGRGEPDRRRLLHMIQDELGDHIGIKAIMGPGYNACIVTAYLSALSECRSRPRVVVVPMHQTTHMSPLLDHPVLGFGRVARAIRQAITDGRSTPRRLGQPTEAEWEAYDRLPAPDLTGERRTMGELDLLANSHPTRRWQQEVRLRHRMDYYYGVRFEPDSPGILRVEEMARTLSAMGLRSVAYMGAVNHEVAVDILGERAVEHLGHNSEILGAAYRSGAGGLGAVVDSTFDCTRDEFSDPLHHKQDGRQRLAVELASAIRMQLAQDVHLPGGSVQGPVQGPMAKRQ